MLGESHYFVDLGNCFSIQEILDLVSTHDKKHSYLKWIVGIFTLNEYVSTTVVLRFSGINWDQSKLGRYPNRNDLDGLNIEKPVSKPLIFKFGLKVAFDGYAHRYSYGELAFISELLTPSD